MLPDDMTIEEFIRRFISAANLNVSINDIFMSSLQKGIDLIYTDDDPHNDYYAEALEMCKTEEHVKELITENPVYYDIILSALIVVLDELTLDANWNDSQKAEISELLDFFESKIRDYGTLGT